MSKTLLIVGGVSLMVVMMLFVWARPWALFTEVKVSESASDSGSHGLPTIHLPTEGALVSWGTFISQEHETTGGVEIYRRSDGSFQLLIRDLETSIGPDVHVYLGTDEANINNGNSVDLGPLNLNRGTKLIDLPRSINPYQYSIVSIWCNQFSVPFGYSNLVSYK